jgi:hypothetical protein
MLVEGVLGAIYNIIALGQVALGWNQGVNPNPHCEVTHIRTERPGAGCINTSMQSPPVDNWVESNIGQAESGQKIKLDFALRHLRRSSGIDPKGQRALAEAAGLSGELSAMDGQRREKGSRHSKQLHIAAHTAGGPGSGLEVAKWLIRGSKLASASSATRAVYVVVIVN